MWGPAHGRGVASASTEVVGAVGAAGGRLGVRAGVWDGLKGWETGREGRGAGRSLVPVTCSTRFGFRRNQTEPFYCGQYGIVFVCVFS